MSLKKPSSSSVLVVPSARLLSAAYSTVAEMSILAKGRIRMRRQEYAEGRERSVKEREKRREGWEKGRKEEEGGGRRTKLQGVRERVEHLRVHVGVEDPVFGRVVSSLDEDRVSLGDGDGESVSLERLGLDLHIPTREREREGRDQLELGDEGRGKGGEAGGKGKERTPSASMIFMSWPSIQTLNMARADMLMTCQGHTRQDHQLQSGLLPPRKRSREISLP
jgi:hypothetical protein